MLLLFETLLKTFENLFIYFKIFLFKMRKIVFLYVIFKSIYNYVTDPQEVVIVAMRNDIRMVSMDTEDQTDVIIQSEVSNAIKVDYDVTEGKVYWVDDDTREIVRSDVDGKSLFVLIKYFFTLKYIWVIDSYVYF